MAVKTQSQEWNESVGFTASGVEDAVGSAAFAGMRSTTSCLETEAVTSPDVLQGPRGHLTGPGKLSRENDGKLENVGRPGFCHSTPSSL